MTREEALEKIKAEIRMYEEESLESVEWEECYEALKQEPCEDAVSRKKVEEITCDEPSYTDALNVLTEVRDKVRALPSVTQKSIECDDAISRAYIEPIIEELENICINGDEYILNLLADIKNAPLVTQKSGRWKVHKNYYECSNCESQISNEFFVNYRFCPHCGADMRGAE